MKQINLSEMKRQELEEYAMHQTMEVEALKAEVEQYRELFKLSQAEKYGPKSEQTKVDENQMSVFNEAEATSDDTVKEPDIASACPPQKKKFVPTRKKGTKAAQVEGVKREVVEFKLTDEEKICPKCGNKLRRMKKVKRSELEITPPQIVVKNHIQEIYVCDYCEKNGTEATIVAAPAPKPLLRGSWVSPSAASWLFTRKYASRDTLYQLEDELHMQGAKINRTTLSNWIMLLSERFLTPIYVALLEELLKLDIVNADETTVQVLHEEGRKASQTSYMWVLTSGECYTEKRISLFYYAPTRSGDVIANLLEDYEGTYLQSDGYSGYNKLAESIKRVACLTHARRKYNDVIKGGADKNGKAYSIAMKGIEVCDELFQFDKQAANSTLEQAAEIKENDSKDKIDALIQWAEENRDDCPKKTLLYDALNYTVNQQEYIRNYLLDPRLRLSNNVAERTVRPFAVGRKMWLFCNTARGADASAKAYSLIETAKANNLDPYKYLLEIFEQSRGKDTLSKTDTKRLLPWNEDIQEKCKIAE